MPSTYEKRLENMLFEYPTSYKNDYRGGNFDPHHKAVNKSTPNEPTPKCVTLKDIHTMTDWKAHIPFDLYFKRKDIVRTYPCHPQKVYTKPIDKDREQAQYTRPRLVMTPAVSMDDIKDPRARALLIDDMYTSDMTRAMREGAPKCRNVTAPLPDFPAPARPVVLEKLREPVVSPEWRMETVTWDNKQLRAYCNPTRMFWQNMELPRCRACDESKIVKEQRKMDLQRVQT